ncbi:MAG: hypothetical protein H6746_17610 [Deltaproteobacteria bacterium]|nr:hypothetical protein [Deltaproteobacteria bacterium]
MAAALLAALAGACDDGSAGLPTDRFVTAFDATQTGWLLSVAGTSDSDLWVAGGKPGAGLMRHFDGSEWSDVTLPQGTPLLDWVHVWGPDSALVVGDLGTVLVWDGATWTPETTPTTQNLWGAWGPSPDDVWAVGGNSVNDDDATILRRDAGGWHAETLPTLARPGVNAFFKVWGTSASDVWVVGRRGAILHWDGASWTEFDAGTGQDLIAVWGTGPDHVAAVGGRNNGILATWNGQTWTSKNLGAMPGLNGVWMRSPDAVHVAGARGTLVTLGFDGSVRQDRTLNTETDVHAVFGLPSGRITGVGGNFLFSNGPYEGIAVWRQLPAGE